MATLRLFTDLEIAEACSTILPYSLDECKDKLYDRILATANTKFIPDSIDSDCHPMTKMIRHLISELSGASLPKEVDTKQYDMILTILENRKIELKGVAANVIGHTFYKGEEQYLKMITVWLANVTLCDTM